MVCVSWVSSGLVGALTQRKRAEPWDCSTYTVEKQHVEVNIQIERRSKTLDQGDRARLGHLVGMARFLDQVRGNDAVNDAQHPPHDLGPAGKQETQLKRETQHPLTHGLFRQYFINQQGGTFGHPPRPTARAETATLTAESDQVLGVARLAANP